MSDNPYIEAVRRTSVELTEADVQVASLREKRLNLMWEARRLGASYSTIADAAGVTKAYVHQVIKKIAKEMAEDEDVS